MAMRELAGAHVCCSPAPAHVPLPQARWLLVEAPTDAPITPRVVLGCLVWALGWATNLHSDETLLNLRRPGETGERRAPSQLDARCSWPRSDNVLAPPACLCVHCKPLAHPHL